MTIYIPNLHALPEHQLSRLAPDARFSVMRANGVVSAYVYELEDMKIVIHAVPCAEVAAHLEGFIGWSQSVAQAQGRVVDEALLRRIRATSIILGFGVEGTTNRDVWHNRVQDLIAMICYNTGALLFWEGIIFDENCQQLLPEIA